MSGYFFISSVKPLIRASVVETPGLTLMTIAEPFSFISLASASAATRPPFSLSDEIRVIPIEESVTVVSTRATLVPADWICFSDGVSALTSTGEISSPSGRDAATESRRGRCTDTSHCAEPSAEKSMPLALASVCAAQVMVM